MPSISYVTSRTIQNIRLFIANDTNCGGFSPFYSSNFGRFSSIIQEIPEFRRFSMGKRQQIAKWWITIKDLSIYAEKSRKFLEKSCFLISLICFP